MKNFTEQELILSSQAVLSHSYSPYSKFRVGAALETTRFIYVGTNVENRSYGLTVCAERVAVFSAVANRDRSFRRMALASDTKDFITPCGACLQVLSEFAEDLPILLVNCDGRIKKTSLKKLYPSPFVLKK